jgi:DNA-binding CsgD family transcriptional regulator
MNEAEQFSVLIGEIYSASLDQSLWKDVINKVALFVGDASRLPRETAPASSNGEGNRISEILQRLHFDKLLTADIAAFGDLEGDTSLVGPSPSAEFTDVGVEHGGLLSQDTPDFAAAALLGRSMTVERSGVIQRARETIVDEAAHRRMRLVVPHIRRAMKVGRRIDFMATQAAALADTLDGLTAGLCLVQTDGRIIHANAAFQAILAEADYLSSIGGRLVAADAQLDRNLNEIFASAAVGEVSAGVQSVAFPLRSSDGESHVLHVLPLASGGRRVSGIAGAAVAALFVQKTRLAMPSSPETIAIQYKLTPTELRVLLAIVEVGGVPEVSDALGIAHTTVKTHLGRLFAKTGTGRQADLVKLVAGFSIPFLS